MNPSPMQSKKFVAYMVADATWKLLAFAVLIWGRTSIADQVWAILLAIIIVAGFNEVGYILGQAALDKFTRIAEIAAGAGQTIKLKGFETQVPPPAPNSSTGEKP